MECHVAPLSFAPRNDNYRILFSRPLFFDKPFLFINIFVFVPEKAMIFGIIRYFCIDNNHIP